MLYTYYRPSYLVVRNANKAIINQATASGLAMRSVFYGKSEEQVYDRKYKNLL